MNHATRLVPRDGEHDDAALGLLALDDERISACLQHARRVVVEGLSDPSFRDEQGHSKARLVRIEAP